MSKNEHLQIVISLKLKLLFFSLFIFLGPPARPRCAGRHRGGGQRHQRGVGGGFRAGRLDAPGAGGDGGVGLRHLHRQRGDQHAAAEHGAGGPARARGVLLLIHPLRLRRPRRPRRRPRRGLAGGTLHPAAGGRGAGGLRRLADHVAAQAAGRGGGRAWGRQVIGGKPMPGGPDQRGVIRHPKLAAMASIPNGLDRQTCVCRTIARRCRRNSLG